MLGCGFGCSTIKWNEVEGVAASCGTLTLTKEQLGGDPPATEDYVRMGCYPTSACATNGALVPGATAAKFALACDLGWRLAASASAAAISLAYYM